MKSSEHMKNVCSKSSVNDKSYFVIFRKLSWHVTGWVCDLPITANQITLFSYLVYFLACLILIFVSYPWNALSAVLIYFAYVLDCVDGNVARYKNSISLGGVFLDSLGHSFVPAVLIFCVGFAAFYRALNGYYLLAGFVASFFFMATAQITAKHETIILKYAKVTKNNGEESLLISLFGMPTFHLCELILFAALFNVLHWLIVFYVFFIPLRYFGAVYFSFRSLSRTKYCEEPQ